MVQFQSITGYDFQLIVIMAGDFLKRWQTPVVRLNGHETLCTMQQNSTGQPPWSGTDFKNLRLLQWA
jgi:hypothetical protein